MLADSKLPLSPQSLETAQGPVREVLTAAAKQIGFVPNMYANMANAPALLRTYLDAQALFRSATSFTPVEQEIVFLTISRENGCEYCVSAHSVIADNKSGVPRPVTDALRAGKALPDARLDALSTFTARMVTSRGAPPRGAVEDFLAAGFTSENVLEVILAIGIKTLSNYTNHVCHTELDGVFESRRWTDA